MKVMTEHDYFQALSYSFYFNLVIPSDCSAKLSGSSGPVCALPGGGGEGYSL